MSGWAVYIATNVINGKQYVGLTKNIDRRWKQHLKTNGSAPALHAAIKKYGIACFVFSHICDAFDHDAACSIERMLIQQHNTKFPNGYNITDGGEGVCGTPLSEAEKEKRRQAMLAFNSKLSAEERSAKYGWAKGRIWDEEQKQKISASNKGKNLGKQPSDETRAKMSLAHKRRPRKPHSEETKEKIRKSLLGRKMPASEKPKHASFLGRKHSEETKAKIRASNIATKALNKARKLASQEVQNA